VTAYWRSSISNRCRAAYAAFEDECLSVHWRPISRPGDSQFQSPRHLVAAVPGDVARHSSGYDAYKRAAVGCRHHALANYGGLTVTPESLDERTARLDAVVAMAVASSRMRAVPERVFQWHESRTGRHLCGVNGSDAEVAASKRRERGAMRCNFCNRGLVEPFATMTLSERRHLRARPHERRQPQSFGIAYPSRDRRRSRTRSGMSNRRGTPAKVIMNTRVDSGTAVMSSVAPMRSVHRGGGGRILQGRLWRAEVFRIAAPDGDVVARLSIDGAELWVSG
jgi:hypothetical protein